MRLLSNTPGKIHYAAEYPLAVHDRVAPLTDFDFLIGLIAQRDYKYRDFYKNNRDSDRYRIVDSGVFEDPQNPPTPSELHRIAVNLEADEVVPTDIINDCKETLRLLREFLNISQNFPFKIQGVVQGATLYEWLYCFWKMHDNPRVDVIGLTYFEVPADLKESGMANFGVSDTAEQARLTLLCLVLAGIGVADFGQDQFVPKLIHRSPAIKPIHLLGCRHCRSISIYRMFPIIRSIDTSFAIQLGMEGKPLLPDSKKSEMKVNFKAIPIRAEEALITENCLRFLQLCQGHEEARFWETLNRML